MSTTVKFTPAFQFAATPRATHCLYVTALTTVLMTIAACGKSEPVITTEARLKAVQTKQETQPDFYAPRKTVDYMADLKSIRESAVKPDAVAKSDPSATGKIEPAKTSQADARPATPPAAVAVPVQPAPAVVAALAPAPVAVVAPRPTADATVTVLSREQPSFPREAVRQSVESGLVRAKVTVNAAGDPTAVSIISARPARVFDREVQTALMKWKFNAGADGRNYETEFNFQR